MDWLRTCYSSAWRLFAGRPDLLTRGYFYKSPTGTPFYPGQHNFGSRLWVNPEIIDAPLGEASGLHVYYRGTPPAPAPPAVLVGTADCIAGGDVPLSYAPGTTVPSGVDSRCYPGTPPAAAPALWLDASDLSALGVGGSVGLWKDRSLYGRDASPLVWPSAPGWNTVPFPAGEVVFAAGQDMSLAVPLVLQTDWRIVSTFLIATDPQNVYSVPLLWSGPAGNGTGVFVSNRRVTLRTDRSFLFWSLPPLFGSILTLDIRSAAGQVSLTLNGVQQLPLSRALQGSITGFVIGSLTGTGFIQDSLNLSALQVWDQAS